MFNITKKEIEWGGRKLTLETGRIARQADGAVLVTYGDSSVLCTVVAKRELGKVDFFPLTVDYREPYSSAGKIPGGFFKREGKSSEKEVLVSRLIDRPIRPLFPDNFCNEIQVICTVMAFDSINDTDIPAMIGASAALSIAGVPFEGPIAGAKVGYINDEFVLNPTIPDVKLSKLDLVVAGTESSVLMVESQAAELSETVMLDAVKFGHDSCKAIIQMIKEFADEVNSPPIEFPPLPELTGIDKFVAEIAENSLREAYNTKEKATRRNMIEFIKNNVVKALTEREYDENDIIAAFKLLEKNIVRKTTLETGIRIDGRDVKTIRPIVSEVSVFPVTHGTALFTRGETQAFVTTTLGTGQDEQLVEYLEGEVKENFMLHYNFPPYSVCETKPLKAPGRREVGHGKLAWRSLQAVLPGKKDFPYTIRVVSEITESNGSSSMATVCGASLSMMDAGVPIKKPVAGIAMGLIKEGDNFVVLSDIMGDEDHLGDMDFKVAGTEQGVTALQMDIKISGITTEIMKIALDQAHEGRIHILGKMAESLTEPRQKLNENAPTITTITIPKDKIREVIGAGGKVIKEICETTGVKIDIEDNGTVMIAASNGKMRDLAIKKIRDIVDEPEMNKVYNGRVVKVMEFGAFVKFMNSNEGLLHKSDMEAGTSVNEGDNVVVKFVGIDNRGKYRLTNVGLEQPHNDAPSDDDRGNRRSSNRPSGGGGNSNRNNTSQPPRKEKRKYF